jgi:prefoldin subunit 5
LKERIDKLDGLHTQVQDNTDKIKNLQDQVTQMMQAQQEYANNMTGGGPPPQITGT